MLNLKFPLMLVALAAPGFGALASDISVIHAGRLMAVPGEPVQTERTVVIRDGVIEAILPGYVPVEDVAHDADDTIRLYDLTGMTVLPGLIDAHVHLTTELGPTTKLEVVERSDADTAFFGARNARTTLMAGFTTVADLNARGDDAIFALRDAIAQGIVPGPRLVVAGHIISPTGGHGQRSGYNEEVSRALAVPTVCDGADECRKVVRNEIRRSADVIKFVATGGVLTESNSGTGQQFFDDEIKAIVDTAHALGRRATAHAHDAPGINAALRAGADSIEHASFADEESFRLFKQNDAFLVPTLLAGATVTAEASKPTSFMAPPIRAKALQVGPSLIEMARRAHAAGVKFAFGTDTGVSKHGDNAREFELLVQAGLTPVEAIRTATVLGADHLGLSQIIGTIEAGKRGDIIAVDGDPATNVSELLDVDFVMKGGVAYKLPGD